MRIRKILFITANPVDLASLRLEREVSEIKETIRRSNLRDQFTIVYSPAATDDTIRRALLDEAPHIVHFAGHGDEPGLFVEDDQGGSHQIPSRALADLFALVDSTVECVVLNACWSEHQASAISERIPYVIGMENPLHDTVAFEFSAGFYDALGAGRDYESAFSFGTNAIHTSGLEDHDNPQLKVNEQAAAALTQKIALDEDASAAAKTNKEADKPHGKRWSFKLSIEVVTAMAGIIAVIYAALAYHDASKKSVQPGRAVDLEKSFRIADVRSVPDTLYIANGSAYRDSQFAVVFRSDNQADISGKLTLTIRAGDYASHSESVFVSTKDDSEVVYYPSLTAFHALQNPREGKIEAILAYNRTGTGAGAPTSSFAKDVFVQPANYYDLQQQEQLHNFVTPNELRIYRMVKGLEPLYRRVSGTDSLSRWPANFVKASLLYFYLSAIDFEHPPMLQNRRANYIQYPLETLALQRGLSRDFAILYATLLSAFDVPIYLAAASPVAVLVYFETGFYLADVQGLNVDPMNPLARENGGRLWLPLNFASFGEEGDTFYNSWYSSHRFELLVDPVRVMKDELQHRFEWRGEGVLVPEVSEEAVVAAVAADLKSWGSVLEGSGGGKE